MKSSLPQKILHPPQTRAANLFWLPHRRLTSLPPVSSSGPQTPQTTSPKTRPPPSALDAIALPPPSSARLSTPLPQRFRPPRQSPSLSTRFPAGQSLDGGCC